MGVTALPEMPWRKFAGAVAVVVLHVAIIAVLLNGTIIHRIFKSEPQETILILRPLPKPEVKRVAPPPPARHLVPRVQPQNPNANPLPLAKSDNTSAQSKPGYQLYDCRTANLPKLTEEQRKACAKAQVGPKEDKGDSVDFADHSDQVPGAARWAREKARKNAPPLLPCASNQSVFATMSTATLACLANGAINGFDLDAQPGYGDKPEEQSHVPNNGDPPPPYTDPDH